MIREWKEAMISKGSPINRTTAIIFRVSLGGEMSKLDSALPNEYSSLQFTLRNWANVFALGKSITDSVVRSFSDRAIDATEHFKSPYLTQIARELKDRDHICTAHGS
jgi:hypothetical protein